MSTSTPRSVCPQIHPAWLRKGFKTEVLQQSPLLVCSSRFHFGCSSSVLPPTASCGSLVAHAQPRGCSLCHVRGATCRRPCHPQQRATSGTATSLVLAQRDWGDKESKSGKLCSVYRPSWRREMPSRLLPCQTSHTFHLISLQDAELAQSSQGGCCY